VHVATLICFAFINIEKTSDEGNIKMWKCWKTVSVRNNEESKSFYAMSERAKGVVMVLKITGKSMGV
jgi:hypothetical protein